MEMTLRKKLALINENRQHLTDGHRKTLSSYKQMCRNIRDEGGRIGGESHVSPDGLKHAEAWADKIIANYELGD